MKNRGALLIELLIVVSLLAVILSIGSQSVFVSMQGGKISGENDAALNLAAEALEAVRSVAYEKWQDVYELTKVTQHYYPTLLGEKWVIVNTGEEVIELNNASYSRYIVVENVCRDNTTRSITGVEPCAPGSLSDPSTQHVQATVSWMNAEPITLSEYVFRWRNQICNQTDWSGGAGSGVKTCPNTNYDSISPSGTIDTSGGTLKLQ